MQPLASEQVQYEQQRKFTNSIDVQAIAQAA
jgi:hypothetical protein